jgi:hypothetical protein
MWRDARLRRDVRISAPRRLCANLFEPEDRARLVVQALLAPIQEPPFIIINDH